MKFKMHSSKLHRKPWTCIAIHASVSSVMEFTDPFSFHKTSNFLPICMFNILQLLTSENAVHLPLPVSKFTWSCGSQMFACWNLSPLGFSAALPEGFLWHQGSSVQMYPKGLRGTTHQCCSPPPRPPKGQC